MRNDAPPSHSSIMWALSVGFVVLLATPILSDGCGTFAASASPADTESESNLTKAYVDPDLLLLADQSSIFEPIPIIILLKHQPASHIARGIRAQFQVRERELEDAVRIARQRELGGTTPMSPRLRRSVFALRDHQVMQKRLIRDRLLVELTDDQEDMITFLLRLGGLVRHRYLTINGIAALVPASATTQLASHPLVAEVHLLKPFSASIDRSVPSVGASSWWRNGYEGCCDVAIVDSGIDFTHPALAELQRVDEVFVSATPSTVGFYDSEDPVGSVGPDDYYGHGTHVAGIAASQGESGSLLYSDHIGVAPGIGRLYNLKVSYRCRTCDAGSRTGSACDSDSECPDGGCSVSSSWCGSPGDSLAALDWVVTNGDGFHGVINLSLGTCSDQEDSVIARFLDSVVDVWNTPIVVAIGNRGPNNQGTSQAECPATAPPVFSDYATAYNAIVVGAVDGKQTVDRADDVLWGGSSRGPVPQSGRRKPDLVAPGVDIFSTMNTWDNGLLPHFSGKTGTSQAAPHVTGALALLMDFGIHEPLAQKALLLNTADDVELVGWDAGSGWGSLNLVRAYIDGDSVVGNIVLPAGQSGPSLASYVFYRGAMAEGERATLTWNRHVNYAGAAAAGYPGPNPLNDLDLLAYREEDNALLYTAVEDPATDRDNVEQIVATEWELFTVVKVRAESASFAEVTAENFALALPRPFAEALAPPAFSVVIETPPAVDAGSSLVVSASIRNVGDLVAHDTCVTLSIPSGFTLVSGTSEKCLGGIYSSSEAVTEWELQASTVPGSYQMSALAESTSYGETFIDPSSPVEVVVASCTVDTDGDGICDVVDLCPTIPDSGLDADGDGLGDACDPCTDLDGDGLGDPGYPGNTCPEDSCPGTPERAPGKVQGGMLYGGITVAGIGDVDSDGAGDFALSASGNYRSSGGRLMVYSGRSGTALWSRNASTVVHSLAPVDDVDGDGVGDVALGSSTNAGYVQVYSGGGTLLWTLTDPDGVSGDYFGRSVAGLGDVNGDGFADIAVSADLDDTVVGSDAGSVTVFSGATGDVLRRLEDSQGEPSGRFGRSLASITDLTGDGIKELVIGALGSHVVVVVSGVDGTELLRLPDPQDGSSNSFGTAVCDAGDVDGDGKADIAVGAYADGTAGGPGTGAVTLFSGATGSMIRRLIDPQGVSGDHFGISVSGVGDIDGDGVPDQAVGASLADTEPGVNAGLVVVFSGATGLEIRRVEDLDGSAGAQFGNAVSALGDVDVDGVPDFVVGAPYDDVPDDSYSVGSGVVVSGASGQNLQFDSDGDSVTDSCDNCRTVANADQADGDSDMFGSVCECDDTSAETYPGALQLCDGKNNDCDDPMWPTVPPEEADTDGDGVRICDGDCDDSDPEVHAMPGEVAVVALTHDASTATTLLDWTEPATGGAPASMLYDVIRSEDPADFGVGAACLVFNAGPETAAADTANPLQGGVFFYDIRAENQCGAGPMGTGSGGALRTGRSCP